ncbi:MAG: rubredoxin [candidate division Zixibacteria bacterium]|nr:rubredoxin [candidate division Zixibacteria bacterium]MBU1470430.1 rubredoxin [candidate division Zixibacteria bacterium]MBU2625816.1 rubredoxin [candidate division Zixibacteria bacterium]
MVDHSSARKHICMVCGWIYDPEEGFPENGIEPGTPFEDLPEAFFCPVCAATKEHFSPI